MIVESGGVQGIHPGDAVGLTIDLGEAHIFDETGRALPVAGA